MTIELVDPRGLTTSDTAVALAPRGGSVPERPRIGFLVNEISRQTGPDFTMAGYATSMTALTDFVGNIESTKWFKKPVEIIDSQVTSDAKTGDLVKFSIKATFVDPNAPAAPPAAAAKAPPKKR